MVGNHILDQLWTLLNRIKPADLEEHFKKLNFVVEDKSSNHFTFKDKDHKAVSFFLIHLLDEIIQSVTYSTNKGYDYDSFFQYAKENFNFDDIKVGEHHQSAIREGFVLSMVKISITAISLKRGLRETRKIEVTMEAPPKIEEN